MEGFNRFDFGSVILTSSRRIGYHRMLAVQATGADDFEPAPINISEKLNCLDAKLSIPAMMRYWSKPEIT